VNYREYTMRELFWMAKGKKRFNGELGPDERDAEALRKVAEWQAQRKWEIMHRPKKR